MWWKEAKGGEWRALGKAYIPALVGVCKDLPLSYPPH